MRTAVLGFVVLSLIALSIWGTINDKSAYNRAQKFMQLQACKNPYYKDQKVKYIKHFYEQGRMEVGLESGKILVLTDDQVVHILCK